MLTTELRLRATLQTTLQLLREETDEFRDGLEREGYVSLLPRPHSETVCSDLKNDIANAVTRNNGYLF
jgi:glutamate/tyrosine decarboxylase-like PLP-dependent enzyme